MQPDTIGASLKEYQTKMQDLSLFGKMVKVVGFAPFRGAQHALENINDISEGQLPQYLHDTLDTNLPKPDQKHKITIGVADKSLATSIKDAFPGLECQTSETSQVIADLLRGIRLHADKLLRQLQTGDIERAQLGLGHSYSRAKVKFNVNRNDNHIIQAISTLDHLDKAVNQFSMRVREWYSWHFPELIRIVSDNYTYARLALFISDKKTLSEEKENDLAAIVDDDIGIAHDIIDAAKVSMGQDVSDLDMKHIRIFAQRVVNLTGYRKHLSSYLVDKMGAVAPNLAALIGDVVGARLISHAGSLTSLAKYPASTVQILGAEKALFRALKSKSNTPKYGLIYHSSFIGRAGMRNKGRISRFLANKCSIASRIDNFSDAPSTRFGDALRQQVEERLQFYTDGTAPTKNTDAMDRAMAMDDALADTKLGVQLPIEPAEDQANGVSEDEAVDSEKQAKIKKRLHKEEKRRRKEAKKHLGRNGVSEGDVSSKKRKHTQEQDLETSEKKKKKREKHRHEKH